MVIKPILNKKKVYAILSQVQTEYYNWFEPYRGKGGIYSFYKLSHEDHWPVLINENNAPTSEITNRINTLLK